MTQMLIDNGASPPVLGSEESSERRWAVVFKLAERVPDSSQGRYLEEIPLRAAFADGPATGPILVMRVSGSKMSAFDDAFTAFQHLSRSSGGDIDFKGIEMIPHDLECSADRSEASPVELIGVTVAAAKLDISAQRVRQLLKENKLPPPYATDGGRPLWMAADFDRFAAARRAALASTPIGLSPSSSIKSLQEFVSSFGFFDEPDFST